MLVQERVRAGPNADRPLIGPPPRRREPHLSDLAGMCLTPHAARGWANSGRLPAAERRPGSSRWRCSGCSPG